MVEGLRCLLDPAVRVSWVIFSATGPKRNHSIELTLKGLALDVISKLVYNYYVEGGTRLRSSGPSGFLVRLWHAIFSSEENATIVRTKLTVTKIAGWRSLNLIIVNNAQRPLWLEAATVRLSNLVATDQTAGATGQATHAIRQSLRPRESMTIGLAAAVYEAAGQPQRAYDCVIDVTARLRMGDEWQEAAQPSYRLRMKGLVPHWVKKQR